MNKKCSVHFSPLTLEQLSQLLYFIDNYAKKPSLPPAQDQDS
jgi:hypothetical protein